MPIDKLFVEGSLDVEVLTPVLQGSPALQLGGSKNSLKPRAWTERNENKVFAGYLRDRDFDFDPPADQTTPQIDSRDENTPVGWRWCRHEIENYLIEPRLVNHAMGWSIDEVENAIGQAAETIKSYQVARWAIGTVRRTLPPNYELNTRPVDIGEFELPDALDAAFSHRWALDTIAHHFERINSACEPDHVRRLIQSLSERFDAEFISNVPLVLLWFSGKDLLAGMASWFDQKGIASPGLLRARLRDWIMNDPETGLQLLPEWRALRDALRA